MPWVFAPEDRIAGTQ